MLHRQQIDVPFFCLIELVACIAAEAVGLLVQITDIDNSGFTIRAPFTLIVWQQKG